MYGYLKPMKQQTKCQFSRTSICDVIIQQFIIQSSIKEYFHNLLDSFFREQGRTSKSEKYSKSDKKIEISSSKHIYFLLSLLSSFIVYL